MGTYSGKYTTRRGNGIAYTYEATWEILGADIQWTVTARNRDGFAGKTSGVYTNGRDFAGQMEHLMRTWAEDTIENQVGID